MAIWPKERRGLLHVLGASTAGCPNIGCVAFNTRQHDLRFNPVFQAGIPGFEGGSLRITTSAFWVCLPGCLKLRGIILFCRTSRCRGDSRSASMFYRFIDWFIDWFKRVLILGAAPALPPGESPAPGSESPAPGSERFALPPGESPALRKLS